MPETEQYLQKTRATTTITTHNPAGMTEARCRSHALGFCVEMNN